MAASTVSELNVAKKNIQEVLGEEMKIYLQLLKSWFKQKLTRAEFDFKARKLLPYQSVHLHNEFLLAILGKCQNIGSSLASASKDTVSASHVFTSQKPLRRRVKKKGAVPKTSFQHRFVPYDPLKHAPQAVLKSPEEEGGLVFSCREMTFPDLSMIQGRMLVAVWELGMDDVQDNAIRLVSLALENVMKNLITIVLSRKNSYKVREKRFRYAMGCPIPSAFLRNSSFVHDYSTESEQTSVTGVGQLIPAIRPSAEVAEIDAVTQLSCSRPTEHVRSSVSLFDMLEALQIYKSGLPVHSVYATTMENIIHRMRHPGNDELEQDSIYHRERNLREEKKRDNATFTQLMDKSQMVT